MNEKNRNDLQEILTQALNEMKEESGEKFNINKVNLAELERRTGISRRKLRRLKANKFVVEWQNIQQQCNRGIFRCSR